ncbi:gas vesicle protein GvpL [Virgibacillus phasianinus]|uniref:Gas vesicle protein GvpL n=1 Tax=Virgibacillus phasianinus TaxID=2017483 RepID=A0A220U1J4_9BACI|nr:GvpL/GvpF family gas vesicle protein [Virgibacillus phasianinus]ASK62114.1 gas vesicle protein GvpL [Virgibacillus phasianinus]
MENLIYLYGLVPAQEATEKSLPQLKGFDGEGNLFTIPINHTTAIVCELNGYDYSEETIADKMNNDMEWLQEKAFHHHETIASLDNKFTFIPLKFCTIYKNESNLRETILASEDKVDESFNRLTDKEEWTLKIYSDDNKLKKQIGNSNAAIEEKRKEISELPRGRQFFERKKIDSLVDKELDKEKDRIGESLHDKLKKYAVDTSIKKNWGKDVTGLRDDMTWNSVYLLPKDQVKDFVTEIEVTEKELGDLGFRIEAAGPWPAYHFSSIS